MIKQKSNPENLLKKHRELVHSDMQKVTSHVQRDDGDWVMHSLMLEGYDVPFKFRRQQKLQSLKGARVNLTYYPQVDKVAGMEFEYMKVVRIKRA